MAAGSTYTPIATTTLGSAASSVTFSSISGIYTDILLVATFTDTSGVNEHYFRINGDTGNNYSHTYLFGSGSSAISGRGTNQPYWYVGGYAGSSQSTVLVNFMNYSNTTTYKSIVSRSNDSNNNSSAYSGLWRNTAAINSIQYFSGNTFTAGSTITLYGIAAA